MINAIDNWKASVPAPRWTEYSTADVAAIGAPSGYCGGTNAVGCRKVV